MCMTCATANLLIDTPSAIVRRGALEIRQVLLELEPCLLQWEGWECTQLLIEHSKYRSPGWPVGPRDSVTVSARLRSPADGTVRRCSRSLAFPSSTFLIWQVRRCSRSLAFPSSTFLIWQVRRCSRSLAFPSCALPKGSDGGALLRRRALQFSCTSRLWHDRLMAAKHGGHFRMPNVGTRACSATVGGTSSSQSRRVPP